MTWLGALALGTLCGFILGFVIAVALGSGKIGELEDTNWRLITENLKLKEVKYDGKRVD